MTLLTTVIGVVALIAVTTVIVRVLGLEKPWLQPWALLRGSVQLGLLSLILVGVITIWYWVALFLAAMVTAAGWTVVTRLGIRRRILPFLAVTIALSAGIPVAVTFAAGAVDFSPRYALALGGIVIGNVMTVITLMGRLLGSLLLSGRDEVEGWLALGATPREAARGVTRSAASSAIIPSTDMARTTGIVTLPGAFVGSVFAGASPLVAAEFQIVVLAAILCAGAIAVSVMTWRFGAPTTLPTEPAPLV